MKTSTTTPGARSIPMAEFRERAYKRLMETRHVGEAGNTRKVLRMAEGLGAATAADLTPDLVERLVAALDAGPLRESTKRNYLRYLKNACAAAVREGQLAASPFDGRRDLAERTWPKPAAGGAGARRPPLTARQFNAVMGHLERRAGDGFPEYREFALIATCVYADLCRQDASWLRVSDLDFEDGLIRVRPRDRYTPKLPEVFMPPELAVVLRGWLVRRSQPAGDRYKLDEHKVAEALRLRAEGLTQKATGERLGVTRSAIASAEKGKNWRGVTAEGGGARKLADSEWLFPTVPTKGVGPCFNFPGGALKAAGEAAGMGPVGLAQLRGFQKRLAGFGRAKARPEMAVIRADMSPVMLGGRSARPYVGGEPKAVLPPSLFAIVRALLDVFPEGLSWKDLKERSGYEARTPVRRLKSSDPDWDAVLKTPGETPFRDCRLVAL